MRSSKKRYAHTIDIVDIDYDPQENFRKVIVGLQYNLSAEP